MGGNVTFGLNLLLDAVPNLNRVASAVELLHDLADQVHDGSITSGRDHLIHDAFVVFDNVLACGLNVSGCHLFSHETRAACDLLGHAVISLDNHRQDLLGIDDRYFFLLDH